MDAFFASLEQARHPEYAGKPIIVGVGGKETHGVVSTASYEARKYGVHSAMPIIRARKLCPFGIYLPVDHTYYSQVSQQIFGGIIASITDQIEQVSVDEAYVDVSGALLKWGSPVAIGTWIRQQVFRTFHITCSVGIGSNKLIAKLASTNAKPDGLLLVPKARNTDFVGLLPIASLNGVGPATAQRLRNWGIETVKDVRTFTLDQLRQAVHSAATAQWLYNAARGNGSATVTPVREEKSVSVERTYPDDLVSKDDVHRTINAQADRVAQLLRAKGLVCRTVSLKLRFDDLHYITRSRTLEMPTDQAHIIAPIVDQLFDSYCASLQGNASAMGSVSTASSVSSVSMDDELPFSVRLVGVGTSSLTKADRTVIQPSLFTMGSESLTGGNLGASNPEATSVTDFEARQRSEAAERALDSIRSKFGRDAARRGL